MRIVWRIWYSDNDNVGGLEWIFDDADSLIFLVTGDLSSHSSTNASRYWMTELTCQGFGLFHGKTHHKLGVNSVGLKVTHYPMEWN